MKKSLLMLFFGLSLHLSLVGQQYSDKKYTHDIDSIYELQLKSISVDHYENYLTLHPELQSNNYLLQYFTRSRIWNIFERNKDDILEIPDTLRIGHPAMIKILHLFDQADSTCNCCLIMRKKEKYEMFESLKIDYSKSEFKILRDAGYRKDREGVGFGLKYVYSKNSPKIGAEISLLNFYTAPYRLKDIDPETGKQGISENRLWNLNAGLLTFGYSRDFQHRWNEINVSLFNIYSPFTFKPLQIVSQWKYFGSGVSSYRPEVGIGIGPLYISAGYNVLFNKKQIGLIDRWVFTAGTMYPFWLKAKN